MGLPVLADRFFTEKRPTREFFAKWQEAGPWSSQLIPVYQWEDLLYVACSDPSSVRFEPGWCLIKANSDCLQKLWQEWQSSSAQHAPLPLPPIPIPLPPIPMPQDELLLLDVEPEADSSSEGENEESVDSEAAPEVLELFAEENKKLKAGPETEEATVPTTTISLSDLTRGGAPTVAATPPLVPIPKPAAAIVKPAAPATAVVANGAGAEWSALWEQLGAHYEHSMILIYSDGLAIPWKWDERKTSSPHPNEGFSVLKPSPFRIVSRTQKSYHGFLIPNEVTDHFFKNWNQGQDPQHLTLCPLMGGDIVAGYLMAWGNASADTKECLTMVEGAAESINRTLQKKPDYLKSA